MSDRVRLILKSLAAFVVGYGNIQIATGYRYVVTFDWVALTAGLIAAGLINTQSPGLQSAMKTMLGPTK